MREARRRAEAEVNLIAAATASVQQAQTDRGAATGSGAPQANHAASTTGQVFSAVSGDVDAPASASGDAPVPRGLEWDLSKLRPGSDA
jgi:hypothetical protein